MQPAFPLRRPTVGLLRVTKLNKADLLRLLQKEILCLMVCEAVDAEAARHIVGQITGSEHLVGYEVEPRFLKIGHAWFDHSTDQDRANHVARTVQYTDETRALCAPFPVPTETFKLDLDLLWQPGANNLRINGDPIYFGMPRALPPGGAVDAHFDWIGADSPGANGIEQVQRQYAVNVYLQTAESGGELALWDTQLSPDDLKVLRIPGHAYALDEAKLGKPDLVVKPEAGSLVFFDATQPHAVRRAEGSRPRVTFSAFMGFSGPERPLSLWS